MKKLKCIIKDNARPKEIRGEEGYIDGYVYGGYGMTAIVYIPRQRKIQNILLPQLEITGYVEI
ncbi:MAG: hypothetical protein LBO06_05195 [Bacteroidales bacterium]|jgi:hypothetical protein|nr:hypothetical protein [Bacteroidales bacterium]